jgi:hypothetical protein
MKKRILLFSGLLALLPGQALSQNGLDQEVAFFYYTLPFLEFKIYRLEWWGHQGRTYFTQASDDLVNWAYFEEIDSGNDQVMWYEVPDDGGTIFLRLQYTDQPTMDLFTSDFDGDHISNWDEITMNPVQGNPLDDSSVDGDPIPDDWERFHGLDPTVADGDLHSDEDRLTNYEEFLNNTDPKNADTDGDHLSDGWEVTYALNPLVDEGVALEDTDGDGLLNYIESTINTNPYEEDTDGDLLPDEWEFLNGTDPTMGDADGDEDGDGLVNSLEYINDLNPRIPDTDDDGLSDGDEVLVYNTSGNIEDSDGDGWIDGSEVLAGSSPTDDGSVPTPVIRILSGNGQVAAAGTPLQGSFQFSIETADGTPLPKAPVVLAATSPTFGQDGGAFLVVDTSSQQGPTVPGGYTFVEIEQVSLVADRNGAVLNVRSPVFLKMPVSANINDIIDISVQSGGSTTQLQATVVSQQHAPVIPPTNLSSTLIDAQSNTHQVTWTNSVTNGPGYTVAVQLNNGSWMTLGTAGPTSTSFSATVPSGLTNPNFSITGNNSSSSPSAQSVPLESSFAEIDLGQCFPFNINTKGQVLAEVNLEVKRWNLGTWESLTMPSNLGWGRAQYDLNNKGKILGYYSVGNGEYVIWDSPTNPTRKRIKNFTGLPEVDYSWLSGFDDKQRPYGSIGYLNINAVNTHIISFIGEKILLTSIRGEFSYEAEFQGGRTHNGAGDFVGEFHAWYPEIHSFTRRKEEGGFELLDYIPIAIGKDGTTLGIELLNPDLGPILSHLGGTNIGDELIINDGGSRLKIPLMEFAANPSWLFPGNPPGSWHARSTGFLIHSDMAAKSQFVVGPGALFKRLFSKQGVALGFQKYTMPEGFIPTDVSENGMIVGYRLDENNDPQGILLLDIKLAVDADQSGTELDPGIEFGGNDLTSETEPYFFWINNDSDSGSDDMAEDLEPVSPDSLNGQISCSRDLEDFSRLWLDVAGIHDKLQSGKMRLGLKWQNVTEGNPGIRIFKAVESDGGMKYLTDEAVANLQKSTAPPQPYLSIAMSTSSFGGPYQQVTIDTSEPGYFFSPDFWNDLPTDRIEHFLFEGVSEGKGELVITLQGETAGPYQVLGVEMSGVWIHLSDIKKMYQHFTVATPDNMFMGEENINPLTSAVEVNGVSKTDLDEFGFEEDYILFVHGWRMKAWERRYFAETAFKRLYWQGYKGRFGFFSWPTEWTSRPWGTAITDTENYMRSDHKASLSGQGLAETMNNLMAAYGGQLSIFAHSMGNIVVSEGLRQGGQARTFVACQAASVARAYDATGPEYLTSNRIYDALSGKSYGVGNLAAWMASLDQHPDVFANYPPTGDVYYKGIRPNAIQIINHHNRLDDALAWWLAGQAKKPNGAYYYDSANDDWYNATWPDPASILLFQEDTYEIFARAAEPDSVPLGASVVSGFATGGEISGNRNLQTLHGFQDGDEDHSAQFRSTIQRRWDYWNGLLVDFGINP